MFTAVIEDHKEKVIRDSIPNNDEETSTSYFQKPWSHETMEIAVTLISCLDNLFRQSRYTIQMTTKPHNIIQSHNNVQWDGQYSAQYFHIQTECEEYFVE